MPSEMSVFNKKKRKVRKKHGEQLNLKKQQHKAWDTHENFTSCLFLKTAIFNNSEAFLVLTSSADTLTACFTHQA